MSVSALANCCRNRGNAKTIPAPPTNFLPDASLTDQGRAVLFAAGAGDLSPSQAAQLMSGLGILAKLVESDELAERVAALEATHGIKS